MSKAMVTWAAPVGAIRRLRFEGPPFVNWAFVLESAEGTALIDTGNPGLADELIAVLREQELAIDHILITHHHETHAANAPAVAAAFECPVWAHKENAPLCRRAGVEVDRTFTAGELLDGTLQVIEAPGHAPGNVAFWVPKQKAMLAGDVVMGLGPSDDEPLCLAGPHAGSTRDQIVADARALLAYDFTALLPAHGRPVPSGGHRVLNEWLSRSA